MRTVFTWIRQHKKQIGAAAAVGVILLAWIIAVSVPGSERDTERSQGELWAGITDALTVSTPKPTETPRSTEAPRPTETPKPSETPQPTETPRPTETPQPTEMPQPTKTPQPAGLPVLDEEYDLVYEGMSVFATNQGDLYELDLTADLYMRQLQDEEGEYIELSMWVDGPRQEHFGRDRWVDGRRRIWHTLNYDEYWSDGLELRWKRDIVRLSKDRALCYYVLERDGLVYLMRYSVECVPNMATMSYKIFALSDFLAFVDGYDDPSDPDYEYHGEEYPYEEGSISVYLVSNGSTDTKVSFPVGEMCAFAETIKGYMESGHLAASALHGAFEVEVSEDRDNPIMPYLYDIFPWLSELAAKLGVGTEGFCSAEQLLTEIQSALPLDPSVVMPDVTNDGKYFITGNYYMNDSGGEIYYPDRGKLIIYRNEDGSYGGEIIMYRFLMADFTGHYDTGILTVTESDDWPVKIEISLADGKATVTVVDSEEQQYLFTFDRNEKLTWPEQVSDAVPWEEWSNWP